ncbi:MAG: hypothetical protein GY847_18145 [Proteobacteria bacterium]|nr:hypothetical protein [Pseudomonadota bacterium]
MQAKEDGVKPVTRAKPQATEEKKKEAAKRQRVRRQKIKVANVLESAKEYNRNIIEEAAAEGEPIQKKIKIGNDTIIVKVPEWLSITGFSVTVGATKK